MKNMKRGIFIALMVIFISTFLISGYFLADYMIDSFKNRETFEEISNLVDRTERPKPTGSSTAPSGSGETVPQQTEPEGPEYVTVVNDAGEEVQVLKDYAEIYRRNNDFVGWLHIDNTVIDYPVMQVPDHKDYYLYLGFYGEYSSHGNLYAKEECDVFTPSDNVTIYGHSMADGSMFHELHNFTDESFWEKTQYFTFDTLKEYNTYQIVAVFRTTANVGGFPYYRFINASSEEEFNEFVETCKSLAYYDTGVTAEYGDKLLTLSTCEWTLSNGRLVILAKRVDNP